MKSALRLALFPLLLAAASGTRASELRIEFGGPTGPYAVGQWKKDWPGCGWQDGQHRPKQQTWGKTVEHGSRGFRGSGAPLADIGCGVRVSVMNCDADRAKQ
jgi:hypothetical protein